MTDTLTCVPREIIAGDSLNATLTYSDYPASAGWALVFSMAGVSALGDITCIANGDNFDLDVTGAQTEPLESGEYQWALRATLGAVIRTIDSSALSGYTIRVTPSVFDAAAGDLQSYAEKMLPIVEAALTALVSGGAKYFMIGTRQVNANDIPELEGLRNRLKKELAREQNGGQLPPIIVGRAASYDNAGWQ